MTIKPPAAIAAARFLANQPTQESGAGAWPFADYELKCFGEFLGARKVKISNTYVADALSIASIFPPRGVTVAANPRAMVQRVTGDLAKASPRNRLFALVA